MFTDENEEANNNDLWHNAQKRPQGCVLVPDADEKGRLGTVASGFSVVGDTFKGSAICGWIGVLDLEDFVEHVIGLDEVDVRLGLI